MLMKFLENDSGKIINRYLLIFLLLDKKKKKVMTSYKWKRGSIIDFYISLSEKKKIVEKFLSK